MPMNMHERLEHAQAAISAYLTAKGEKPPANENEMEDTYASDLIADLLHLQKALGNDIDLTIDRSKMHYEAEQEEEQAKPKRAKKSSPGKLYSILLLYPDYINDSGTETYFAHVRATKDYQAVSRARAQAKKANADTVQNADDFTVLLCLEGHHPSLPLYDK